MNFVSQKSPKIIVWDLVNVLFEPNKFYLGRYIIWQACGANPFSIIPLGLLWMNKKLSQRHMLVMMADVLHAGRYQTMKRHQMDEVNINFLGEMHKEYLAGVINSTEALQEIQAGIARLTAHGYFSYKLESRLVEATLKSIFDPVIYAKSMRPIKNGVALLRHCAQATTTPMMVLSNWALESFPLVVKKNPEIFHYFKPQNVFISAQFGKMEGLKPHPWVFHHVMTFRQEPPSNFVLIDDQLDNIQSARTCGMHALWVENDDYKKVEAGLKELGFI